MIHHSLVCPFNEKLISFLNSRNLIVKVNNPDEINQATKVVREFNNNLKCIILKTSIPLSAIKYNNEWRSIPIALYTPAIGNLIQFLRNINDYKNNNLRIYLPLNNGTNFINIRILSSLGIASAVIYKEKINDWESLIDLMTYAILGRVKHATIDPFHYIASHYTHDKRINFGAVYFDDPSMYLHLNNEGHVALSNDDLSRCRFISSNVNNIRNIEDHPAYTDYLNLWTKPFLSWNECSYCIGWRVCLGKFYSMVDDKNKCSKFAAELIEIVEQYQINNKYPFKLWEL